MEEIQLNICNACNLRCVFCYAHSPFLVKKKKAAFFDFNIFKRLIDQGRELGVKRLTVSGDGEPTLHPQFLSFIKYARNKISYIELLTNATFDEAIWKGLYKVDSIKVNLSAPDAETYKTIHRPVAAKQLFQKVMRNIRFLVQISKFKNKDFLSARFMVNRYNFLLIEDYIKLCYFLGLGDINFKMFKPRPGTRKLIFSGSYLSKLRTLLFVLCKKKFRIGHDLEKLLVSVKEESSDYGKVSFYNSIAANNFKCPIEDKEIFVDINGDVYVCEESRNFLLGNLKRSMLKDLLNSKMMDKFRKLNRGFSLTKTLWKNCFYCPYAYAGHKP